MDRLSSGTLPIIEYGGGLAIRLYAMWTLFQHFSISVRYSLRLPLVSISASQLLVQVIGQGRLAVKILEI
jgi:hypothetical protein